MPFCPVCKTEYREGFTECADCGVALVDKLPTAEHPNRKGKLVSICGGMFEPQAQAIVDMLRTEGIPAMAKSIEGLTSLMYLPTSSWSVLVYEEDAERARKLLDDSALDHA